ncbi:MAG: transposase [Pseudomonadota bacterium]
MRNRKNNQQPTLFNPKAAGRPRISRSDKTPVPHRLREEIPKKKPVHVVWHLNPHVPPCRRKNILLIFKKAVLKGRLMGLKVIHFSLMNNHLHLLIETENKKALAKALQSFAISFTKRLKNFNGLKKTPIFKERYFCHILKSLREVKHAIHYILMNGKKAGLSRYDIDPYSSAINLRSLCPKLFPELDFNLPRVYFSKITDFWQGALSPPSFWILRKFLAPTFATG